MDFAPIAAPIKRFKPDKELERRGHLFVRYADDCNIFVSSREAGARVMHSLSKFIENKLKLKINGDKSKVCEIRESKFSGYTVLNNDMLAVSHRYVESYAVTALNSASGSIPSETVE